MEKSEYHEPEVVYLEGDDAFLDAFCITKCNMSIVVLDQKLNELPSDNPNKELLKQYRHQLIEAIKQKNLSLAEAWLDAFFIGLKAAAHTVPLALVGEKFKQGRKPETGGPVRKAAALVLKDHPEFMPRHVWKALEEDPPKGWKFYAPKPIGKYIEGPRVKNGPRPNMGYTRFCQVCKEEKDKLKS